MNRRGIVQALSNADVLLSGGGSLLQDRTSVRSLLYYLGILWFARRRGLRTMVFAQGVGPLLRPASRRLTARTLSRVDAITVRDPVSAQLLRTIGVPERTPIEVTADPVFALDADSTRRDPNHGPLAVALRDWPGVEEALPALFEALSAVARETALEFWPLHAGDDLALAQRAAAAMPGSAVVAEPMTPVRWATQAAGARAVFAMRLHALIFGAAQARPVLGLSYDPKVDALLECVGAPPAIRLDGIDPGAVERSLRTALADQQPGDRRERAASLRAAALRNAAVASALAGDAR